MAYDNHVTVVKCVSATPQYFGYLSSQGLTLQPGQELVIEGDLLTRLRNAKNADRVVPSFLADIADGGPLRLISTPKDHFWDTTGDIVQVLDVDANTVAAVPPSWGGYSESESASESESVSESESESASESA